MDSDEELLRKEVETLISCPICTNKYFCTDEEGFERIPKVLECMHTFCDVCLKLHLQSVNSNRLVTTSNFPCPTCRKTMYVPIKGFSAFPTDFKIKHIISLFENLDRCKSRSESMTSLNKSSSQLSTEKTNKNNGGIKNINQIMLNVKSSQNQLEFCKLCSFKGLSVKGTHFCLSCFKVFCLDCKKTHLSNYLFTEHRFYNIDETEHFQDAERVCKIHSSEFDYFCQDCNKKLCCICVMLPEHNNHYLKSANKEGKSDEQKQMNKFQEDTSVQLKNKNDESNLKELYTEFDSNIFKLEQKITNIDAVKVASIKSLEQFEVNLKQAYTDAKVQLENSYLNFSNYIKHNKSKLNSLNSLKKKFETNTSSAKKIREDFNKTTQKNFDQTYRKMFENNVLLSEMDSIDLNDYNCQGCTFTPSVKIELGEIVQHDTDHDQLHLNVSTPQNAVDKSRKDRSTKNCEKQLSIPEKVLSGSQTKLDSDAKVKKACKSKMIKKDALLKLLALQTFTRKTNYKADIASNDFMYRGVPHWKIENQLSCRKCCFIDGGKILIMIDQKELNVEKQIICCRSVDGYALNIVFDLTDERNAVKKVIDVCYNSEKKCLYFLCNTNNCASIKKFKLSSSFKTSNCQELIRLKSSENIELQSFVKPTCLASRKDVIAILDSNGEKVTIMNSKFTKLHELLKGDISKANYIAVDVKEKVYVSDFGQREIKVFQKNGNLELKFSSTGARGQVLLPQCLALDDRGNVMVVDQSMRCVSLYDKEGHFVDVLVENFEQSPWGLALTSDKYLLAVTTDDLVEVYKL